MEILAKPCTRIIVLCRLTTVHHKRTDWESEKYYLLLKMFKFKSFTLPVFDGSQQCHRTFNDQSFIFLEIVVDEEILLQRFFQIVQHPLNKV